MTARSEDDGEDMEYVYDEIYFQSTSTRDEIENDLEYYWQIGQTWSLSVPETDKQKIERLERELAEAKTLMEQSQIASDMAIAELTMVMANMMGGGEADV